jgi:neutral amino acid transport system substrate-binding protein
VNITRRLFVTGSTIALATPALLRAGFAQSGPIMIGSLTPRTGGGAP